MATEFLYSDGDGVIPESQIAMIDDTTWVAMNCSITLLPPRAIHYIDSVSHHPAGAVIKEDGTFAEMEWSLLPDWHHHVRDYRGWMPVSLEPRFDDPWFLQTAQAGLILTSAYGTYILAESWRNRIDQGFAASHCCGPGHRHSPSVHRTSSSTSRVRGGRLVQGTQLGKGRARSSSSRSPEYAGAAGATCSHWARDLTKETVNAVGDFRLDRYGKRGVLINLARDWKEISLHTLLKNGVPVLYPWTVREEVDARFACLAPSILSAFREKCVAAGGQNRAQFADEIAESATFKKLFLYSLFMDDPPPEYTPPPGAPTTISKQASVRIIDFPGWGSRDVITKKQRERCRKMFYFGTFGKVVVLWRHRPISAEASKSHYSEDFDSDGETDEDDDDEDDREDGALDGTEELMFIREQYKGNCAPRPGQTFDPETGFQRDKPYMGITALQRFTADLNRALPPSSASQAFRAAREAVEEVARMMRDDQTARMEVDSEERAASTGVNGTIASPIPSTSQTSMDEVLPAPSDPSQFSVGSETISELSFPSSSSKGTVKSSQLSTANSNAPALLNRLSSPVGFPPLVLQPPSLMSRLSGVIPTGPRADRQAEGSRSQSGSSSSRKRSASPPRHRRGLPPRPVSPQGGFRKPNSAQAAALNAWLQGSPKLAHEVTFESVAESWKWDTKFLDHAYLLMESFGAEVRLRYLAIATGAETVAEVLDLALARCIPFRLAIRESALHFRERNLSSAERSITAAYFPVGSGEAPLEYGRGGAEFSNEYNRRFLDLLRRPHMRRLASMGGVFGWLAWRTEMGLVDDFMKGPSIQVTQFGRGWNDGHKDTPLHVTCDELSFRDQETLLGHVRDGSTDRWVWPTEALLLELCAHYSGEMNPEVDVHLAKIYSEVKNSEVQARSHSQWEKFFRRGNRGAHAPATPKITKGELKSRRNGCASCSQTAGHP
ncbi:hypothetical protein C8R47DRAFT_1076336 [Mycena vitilis]|nr:hypothetical protein C8R47DRAFT_1076336 [Mycena vitilis]